MDRHNKLQKVLKLLINIIGAYLGYNERMNPKTGNQIEKQPKRELEDSFIREYYIILPNVTDHKNNIRAPFHPYQNCKDV